MPEHLLEVVARFTRGVRESPAVDQRSGVSARFAHRRRRDASPRPRCAASALHRRAPSRWPGSATCRPWCRTLRGKVEFEIGEEGREVEVLAHLLRIAIAETFRARLAGLDLSGFTDLFAEGAIVETGELVPAAELLAAGRHRARAWPRCSTGSASATTPTPAQAPPAVEFALEGLHLTRRLAKDDRRRPHRLRRLSRDARRRPSAHGRFRYGPWHGGPDPLAPPYDVRAALDEIGDDVLAGGSLREALRDLLRRGPGRPAAAWTTCADRVRRLRREAPRRGRPRRHPRPGPGRCSTRRSPPSGTPCPPTTTTTPGFAEAELDALPADTAGAVRGAGRLRLAVARGRGRPTSRSRTCCAARCSTRSSAA